MVSRHDLDRANRIVLSIMTKTMPTQINDIRISYEIKTDVNNLYPSIKIYWKIDMPIGDSFVSQTFGMNMCIPEGLEKDEFLCEHFTRNAQAKVDDLVMRFVKGIVNKDLSAVVENDTPI